MKTPERVELARELREDGHTYREIGDLLGVAFQTVATWLTDPDGSRMRARKDSYAQPCVDCGAMTSGYNGRRAEPRCIPCTNARKVIWDQNTVIAAIQRWDILNGRPPTAREWRTRRGGYWPTSRVVQYVFGSWNAGIAAAGLEPVPMGRYRDETKRGKRPVAV